MTIKKVVNGEEEKFFMRVCEKCNLCFFSTARGARICFSCLSPKYKKHFFNRGIKYLDYPQRNIK
jgi:hypothetical protein